jgi:hypothetical protein
VLLDLHAITSTMSYRSTLTEASGAHSATDPTIPIASLNFTPAMIFINRLMFIEAVLAFVGLRRA